MKEYVAKLSEGNRQTAARPNCSPTPWQSFLKTGIWHKWSRDQRRFQNQFGNNKAYDYVTSLCNQPLSLDLQIWSFPRCQVSPNLWSRMCTSRSICHSSRRSSCRSSSGSSRSRSSTRTTTCEAAIVLLGRKSSSPPTHISPNTLSLSWGKSDFGREN